MREPALTDVIEDERAYLEEVFALLRLYAEIGINYAVISDHVGLRHALRHAQAYTEAAWSALRSLEALCSEDVTHV
ncbi:MAG TPA: hypothetical protein VIL65_13620 [Beijerinckiaceae bacterium]|jgi:hypothetical protein